MSYDKLLSIDEALAKLDRTALAQAYKEAETEREEILRLFPLENWREMPVEKYALGFPDSFCRWLEYTSRHQGSMKGDYAPNKLIYRRTDGSWYYDGSYQNEQEAWQAVRQSFVNIFGLAGRDNFAELFGSNEIRKGAMIRTKALYIYFPDKFMPIYSRSALQHFWDLVQPNRDEAEVKNWLTTQLNRELTVVLQADPRFSGLSNWEIMRFFFSYFDPRKAERILKVATGPNGRYWSEFKAQGIIAVGGEMWDDVGDLRDYDSKEALIQKLVSINSSNSHLPTISKEAGDLLSFRELKVGDKVVANQGKSKVLAVGTVSETGYEWQPERAEYKHTVKVEWDTSISGEIEPQPKWIVTIADVPAKLYQQILSLKPTSPKPDDNTPPEVPVDHKLQKVFREIAEALERKGQVILYGPPGTGKTFTARQFAAWWLLGEDYPQLGETLVDDRRFKQELNKLSRIGAGQKAARFTFLTFHPSYTYEDFIEGFKPVKVAESTSGGLSLRLEDGIFKRVCQQALTDPGNKYLVLVDEINRANLAKVFGELITLLEKDKRDTELILPQSREPFQIPSNLYLVGSMNTADKSIKLLDAALRRRFAFKELMPDTSLLEECKISNLRLDSFLAGLNRRVASRLGREKQIGHSFLLTPEGKPVSEAEEFARRFRQEILPLLQEYCYDNYAELAYYIGDRLVNSEEQTLNFEVLEETEELLAALAASFNGAEGE